MKDAKKREVNLGQWRKEGSTLNTEKPH